MPSFVNLDPVLLITGWDRIVQVAAVAGAPEAPLPLPHHPQLRGQLSHLLRTLRLLGVQLQQNVIFVVSLAVTGQCDTKIVFTVILSYSKVWALGVNAMCQCQAGFNESMTQACSVGVNEWLKPAGCQHLALTPKAQTFS